MRTATYIVNIAIGIATAFNYFYLKHKVSAIFMFKTLRSFFKKSFSRSKDRAFDNALSVQDEQTVRQRPGPVVDNQTPSIDFETVEQPEYQHHDSMGDMTDYLGAAAEGLGRAKLAIKEKRFDDAWSLLHGVKDLYTNHVNRSGFSEMGAIALDATVHEHLANILRMEKKHKDALTHIVYWIVAQSERPKKRHGEKFKAYFNRCKFTDISAAEAWLAVDGYDRKTHPFFYAQELVNSWY